DRLLIVATDRISAFDVVLPSGIPAKGIVLTQLSLFWFHLLGDLLPNHVITANVAEYGPELARHREQLEGRTMIVLKTDALPAERGIILAETKFEFGVREGRLIWIDEELTPDSSRFWPRADYAPGRGQPSFDKQYVRDYLETLAWDKRAPGPPLPAEVVERTRD